VVAVLLTFSSSVAAPTPHPARSIAKRSTLLSSIYADAARAFGDDDLAQLAEALQAKIGSLQPI
jgi:hypothetical protein